MTSPTAAAGNAQWSGEYGFGPDGYQEAISELPEGRLAQKLSAPSTALTLVGLCTLGLLLLVPFWNACLMLQDSVVSYFCGSSTPVLIFMMCFTMPCLYAGAVRQFFKSFPEEARTEQTMLALSNSFICLLGFFVLLLSMQLRSSAFMVSNEIALKPQFGTKAFQLYTEWQQLVTLRVQPNCTAMPSVEECQGFRSNSYSRMLKEMETKYSCTGWGFDRAAASATAGPPTLFSGSEYTASCDGMAALSMEHFLQDSADEFFYEGVYLVAVPLCIGVFHLLGFIATDNIYSKEKLLGYGSAP